MPDVTDWKEALPEDLRADPSLASFKDVGSLAKSYRETKALVGSSIRPPGPDAAPEARKAFIEKLQQAAPELIYAPDNADETVLQGLWARLGRPGKPEDYEVPEEATKAGLKAEELRALGQSAGLTKAQLKTLAGTMAQARTAEALKFQAAQDALKTEWGAAHGERVKAAAAAALKLGMSPEAVKAVQEGGVPAEQVKFLFAVSQAVGANPKELDRQKDGGGSALTPTEAKLQLAEIRSRKEYWDRSVNPMLNDQLKAKVLELTALAFP